MLYVVIVDRVVKVNTGATDKYAPRSANQTKQYASGPFSSFKAAQRAVLAALASHTCLAASVWSEEQVREQAAKGGGSNRWEFQQVLDSAVRMIESPEETVR